MKRTPLTRKTALNRKPFKRKAPKPSGTDLGLAKAWWKEVTGYDENDGLRVSRNVVPCVVCGSTSNIEAHHVISKQSIKREAKAMEWGENRRERALWDSRNGLAVCQGCHAAHETASARIPRQLLPKSAIEFAVELDLVWEIERWYYPPVPRLGAQ